MESIRSTICEACNNLFDLKSRKPVIILCGHTICETCFHQVCQPQQENAICPIDKEQIDVIPGKTIYNKSYMKRLEDLTPTYKIICACNKQLLCEYLCKSCQIYLCSQCSVVNHFGHQTVQAINYQGIDLTFEMLLEAADFVQNQLETNLGVLKEYKEQIFKMVAKCQTTDPKQIKSLMIDSKTFFQKWLTRLNYPSEFKQSEQLRVQSFETINESNCCLRMSQANLTQQFYNSLTKDFINLSTSLIFNSLIDGTNASQFYEKVQNKQKILVIVKTENKEIFAVTFNKNQNKDQIAYDAYIKSPTIGQMAANGQHLNSSMQMSQYTFTQDIFIKIVIDQMQLVIVDNCDETNENISNITFSYSGQGYSSQRQSFLNHQNFKVMHIEAYQIV
eukprot:403377101